MTELAKKSFGVENLNHGVGFEVVTAVVINVAIWDTSQCSPYVNQCFGGTYHLHIQGRKSTEQETSVQQKVAFIQVKAKVILRPTVSRSVCPGVRAIRARDQFFFPPEIFLRRSQNTVACSASELYRQNDRSLSAKLVPFFRIEIATWSA
jgi:hypothetical protein